MPKFGEISVRYDGKDYISQRRLELFNGITEAQLEVSENKEVTPFYEIKETIDNDEITLSIKCGAFEFLIYGRK